VSLTGDTKKKDGLAELADIPCERDFGSVGWRTPEGGHRRRANSTVASPAITATLDVLVCTLLDVFSINILCVIFPTPNFPKPDRPWWV
jgi:hypothetical protein